MKNILLLLCLISSFVACGKPDTPPSATQTKKDPVASTNKPYSKPQTPFSACEPYHYKQADKYASCMVDIYDKDPQILDHKGLDGDRRADILEEIIQAYWRKGRAWEAIEVQNKLFDEEEEEYTEELIEEVTGEARTQFLLADNHFKKKEYKKAFDLFKGLINNEQTKADASYALAYLYFAGLGTPHDPQKAKELLGKLGINDNCRFPIATKYIIHDFYFLKEASDKNDPVSQYLLACLYEEVRITLGVGQVQGCELAYDELVKSINNGYAPAMHYLARYYWDDSQLACGYMLGEDQWGIFDGREALKLYTKAAKLGYYPSQILLGDAYSAGEGFLGEKPNPKLAFKWYSEAAKSNEPDALYEMLSLYYNGEGTQIDYTKAFDIAQRIKDVEPGALVWLGKMYFYGNGTKQDYKKAFEAFDNWMKIKGKPFMDRYNFENASYFLGLMYQSGWGTKSDPTKAKTLLKQIGKEYIIATDNSYPFELLWRNALENNNIEAQLALAQRETTPPTTAMMWYAMAASNGNQQAETQFKKMYSQKFDIGTIPDIELFKKALQKDAESQVKLGKLYLTNYNTIQAFFWFSWAAWLGNKEAMYQLGLIYKDFSISSMFYPDTVKDDEKECKGTFETLAYKWFKKAAELGNADAQFRLGKAYETGIIPSGTAWWYGHCMTDPIVISKDEEQAKKWYKKAAALGHGGAKFATL